jgi:hypothetical protein
MNTQQLLALATTLLMAMPAPVQGAAAKALGTAEGQGTFEVNRKVVSGTGSIAPGDEIVTRGNGSTVRLGPGGRGDLAPQSIAVVHEGRLELRGGTVSAQGLGIEAGKLTIVPEAGASRATVQILNGRVNVNAHSGRVQVKNAEGVLLAQVLPGKPLAFAPAAGRRSGLLLHGTMEASRGNHFLTDETASVKFQLSGLGLDRYSGRRVTLTGHMLDGVRALDGASGVVAVELVQLAAYQPPAAGAAGAGSSGSAGAGGAAGAAGGTASGGAAAGAGAGAGAGAAGAGAAGAGAAGAGAAGAGAAAAAGAAGAAGAAVGTVTVVSAVAIAGGVAATAVVVKNVTGDSDISQQ